MARTDAAQPPSTTVEALRGAGRRVWHGLDELWCRTFLATVGDRPGLLSFLFHAVSPEEPAEDIDLLVDPAQTISARDLAAFVRYFQAHGYAFVSPAQIRGGLDPAGRYVLMTFDDGYFNNLRTLPVLRELDVPAVFFVATRYTETGKAFWWDVLYRERLREGRAFDDIVAEREALKPEHYTVAETYLIERFGPSCLEPVGDEDRPMTLAELQEFARDPHVHIGNHTRDHAILTYYSTQEAEEQIRGCQDDLEEMIGERPLMISYPNGNHSSDVIAATRRTGIDLGVVFDNRRGSLPAGGGDPLALSRFCFTRTTQTESTFRGFRATVSLRRAARGRLMSILRGW